MATSGNKSVTVTAQHTLKFSWSLDSQSVANNTSKISWKMELVSGGGNISSSASKAWSITVNGTKYSGTNTVGISTNTTKTLASGTTTIAHSTDGTKTFNYSFSQQFDITYSGSPVKTISGSGSGTLTTIPRASSISASNNYVESQSTITINRASSSFTHTLQYKINGQSAFTTIVNKTTATSYKWTIPKDTYNYISATGKTVTITINCITYSGSTKIGESTDTLTATCKESLCKPTLSPVVKDVGSVSTSLTGDSNKVIKGYNIMSYSFSDAARNGATIKSRKVTCGSKSNTAASGTLDYVTSNVFTFTVTDSRGFTTTQTVTKTLINYVNLTCNLTAQATLDNSGTDTSTAVVNYTVKGNYFNGSFGAKANTLKLELRWKTNSGGYSSWAAVTPTISGNTYTYSGFLDNLDYQNNYTVQARVTDGITFKESGAKTVKAVPVFDWSSTDFKFNVPVYTENGYSLTGLAKALSNAYSLDTTGTTAGANWTNNEFTAVLMGTNLRCTYDFTRSSATGTGNITNENVLQCKIKHSGKIRAMYSNSFASGGTGGVATYAITNPANDGTYITFNINIAANATAITQSTGAFILPVIIDTTKY